MQSPTIINFDGSDVEYGGAMYQGSTFEALVTVRDIDGIPVSLADYTVRAQFRKSYTSTTYYSLTASLVSTVESGITYPTSTIRLYMGALSTAAIPTGLYKYDVELAGVDVENVLKPFLGNLKVLGEVTK